MRRILSIIAALILAAPVFAQVACTTGTAITQTDINMGSICTPAAMPTGTFINRTAQTTTMGAQTVCAADATCPAGFVVLYVYIRPTTAGTVVSALSSTLTFTDSVGTVTNMSMGANASLLSLTPSFYAMPFYHAANTAITVNCTGVTLTGSPVYNFTAQLEWLHT
jgi:hypothetical protein